MEKMLSIQKERLRYAREYYRYSINDVSSKTKLQESLLKKFEEGADFPSYSQLEKLAELFNQPLFFFFMKKNPLENKAIYSFRSIESRKSIELNVRTKEMIEKANIFRLNLEELFEKEETVYFSKLIKEDNKNSSQLSSLLRDMLDLPLQKQKEEFKSSSTLLEYIREKLFDKGVYVFKDSFRDNNVAGLCIYDDKYPIILLNNKTTLSKQLFTLFHEIYHLYNREEDVDFLDREAEKSCDEFSSEFLIPEDDFNRVISSINNFEDKDIIQYLSSLYCVSEDAIMYRLNKKHLISNEFYTLTRESNIRFMNSQTSGGNYYYTKMSYLGRKYISKVFDKYYSGILSVPQVGKFTQLKPIHVAKLASSMFGGEF